MLETYQINYKGKKCGYIEYDVKQDKFKAVLTVNPQEEEFPRLLFTVRGKKQVGDDRVRKYIKAVVAPKSRDNIGDMLQNIGLRNYDEWNLYKANKGLNANDYASIVEVKMNKNNYSYN